MIRDYWKILLHYLLPKKALTLLAGALADVQRPWVKNWLIRQFIRSYGVNMQEASLPESADYPSFNAFFIRHLRADARPIAEASVISPVDGTISAIGDLQAGQMLQAKGKYYSVDELLASETMAVHFQQGRFATLYLAPKDYHRVHMPLEGSLVQTVYLPGTLFSVQPATVRHIPSLFARNERLVAYFDTPLGLLAMVMVGATIVGAIGTSWGGDEERCKRKRQTDYREQSVFPQPRLPQGGEMGYFKLGSTVIMLFADGQKMQWKPELAAGQVLRFGQAMAD
ncbi:MAG: phosphatidylserine decarboxylase [Legionellaceae bacterium]|nr:phosphatidylserine decarboxylase [Legionellaceae bacterium]